MSQKTRSNTRLKSAGMIRTASIGDVDLSTIRDMDSTAWHNIISLQWIKLHQNVLILGSAGAGKTFLASVITQRASSEGFTALYQPAHRLFHKLTLSKTAGNYRSVLDSISRNTLLVIDDFLAVPLTEEQRQDLLILTENRYGNRSTLIASSFPIALWGDRIGNLMMAEAIASRLLSDCHALELKTFCAYPKRQ